MAEFWSVGRVQVSLWGRKVGVLVPSPERGYYAFKFDRSFLDSGIQIAPLIRRWARDRKYDIDELPALDKLCYVGNRAMGARLRAVAGDGADAFRRHAPPLHPLPVQGYGTNPA